MLRKALVGRWFYFYGAAVSLVLILVVVGISVAQYGLGGNNPAISLIARFWFVTPAFALIFFLFFMAVDESPEESIEHWRPGLMVPTEWLTNGSFAIWTVIMMKLNPEKPLMAPLICMLSMLGIALGDAVFLRMHELKLIQVRKR
jgi:hypothetical protein